MKIGIGVTTYNRPKHLELFKAQIALYHNPLTENQTRWHIADDSADRKGIAYRKNQCLRALKDCDYIFLFDDDCFPIKEGWAEFFIEASKASGQQHFQYLKQTPTIKELEQNCFQKHPPKIYPPVMIDQCIKTYNNCSGCMMFFTKEVIEKVGAYNHKYGIYGFEHAGYSNRIHAEGLTPLGAYTCPAGAGEYIYSMDLDFHLPFNKEVNHKPSIEINKLAEYVEQNKSIYLQDNEIYIPL